MSNCYSVPVRIGLTLDGSAEVHLPTLRHASNTGYEVYARKKCSPMLMYVTQHRAAEWTTARVLAKQAPPQKYVPLNAQGKCTTPPTGSLAPSALALGIVEEEPWQAPRCVIVTSDDLFIVDRSRLWIDALHIQVVDGTRIPIPIKLQSWGVAYVTNTVVQGDRASNAVGVEAFRSGGGLYAEGARACASVHVPFNSA